MTTTSHRTVRLDGLGSLIAAIPALLGFMPARSLVVVTHRGPTFRELGLVLRADLPPSAARHELAEQLLAPVAGHRDTAATLVVLGGPDAAACRRIVDAVRSRFREGGVPVVHAVSATSAEYGRTWRCLDDRDCRGRVADPCSGPVAALSAVSGSVVHASREELESVLEPDPVEVLDRRASLMQQRSTESGSDDRPEPSDLRAMVRDTAARFAAGEVVLTDHRLADLADAVGARAVRDSLVLGRTADEERDLHRLWVALTKALPVPERAEAACLLGVSSYLSGDGALAGIALDRALVAQPGHRLATLLITALQTGVPPQELRARLEEGTAEADCVRA